ncbi:MAG: sigma-70 family RNA polymerase sigma factor [Nitrospinaceae bacterium]|jgi:RNA polymerase sigma-70 factor, ECF subfamily|nr:sigma-70 family RNA polymerase sigma factor [Nitrospinaceae bacterium]MBT3433592.1 sigma-70 family RNA polymerase sigma factor [Nitrospinaceae bacterium]MBT3822645.1 sigma-70 family RNA polymerase sigma factor [Nitrospinaceae bacterium]MBT4095682.1 sigma-70 family RNA polymerase sigma factor [Nitrospinaceae bacterium]MBT4428997.1 sigma-70 family RNA polymerase sigma factor [Nitrospinaceae bacterium]
MALDRREFETLALEHIDALYRGALRLSGNPEDAEDLVQDVYVRAIRFYTQFQPGTNIRAWLFKILKNTFINRFRKKSRTPTQLELDDSEYQRSDLTDFNAGHSKIEGPEAQFFKRQTSKVIEKALSEIPEKFRRIIVLSDIEGFSYREIAEIEECPLGTVMSRLYRSRRMLQALLVKYDETGEMSVVEEK